MGCQIVDPVCMLASGAGQLASSGLEALVQPAYDALASGLAALGTLWIKIPTASLLAPDGQHVAAAAITSPETSTVLGWVKWLGLVIAIGSLMVAGVMLAHSRQRGQASRASQRILIVLFGAAVISSAPALVGWLMPAVPAASGIVMFTQQSLGWFTAAAAVLGVVVAGIRLAWEQRTKPAEDLVRSLLTLILVAGVGATAVTLLAAAGDHAASALVGSALSCDPATDSSCFSSSLGQILMLSGAVPGAAAAPVLLVIVIAIVGTLVSLLQIALMLFRTVVLVVLTGVAPTAAATTSTASGREWFKKLVGWTAAFLLYKPVAALIYAVGLWLVGSGGLGSGDAILAGISGLIVLVLAVVALPALLRVVAPAISVMSGSGGGGALAGAAMALPSGAVAMSGGGGFGARGSGGGSAPPLASGASSAGSSGATGAAGSSGAAAGGSAAAGSAAAGAASGGATLAVQGAAAAAQAGGQFVRGAADAATGDSGGSPAPSGAAGGASSSGSSTTWSSSTQTPGGAAPQGSEGDGPRGSW
jgi:hypothetical protein